MDSSLAASITAEDVRLIRARYPGLPVVTYVNTTAAVKAETDICCTSANAVQVVEAMAREWGVDRVILLPDEFLARNVARQTDIGIIAWQGRCEVHELFTAADIAEMRLAWPDAQILAHPECPTEVLEAADFAGSTAAMTEFVMTRKPRQVVLITECSWPTMSPVMRLTLNSFVPAICARTCRGSAWKTSIRLCCMTVTR